MSSAPRIEATHVMARLKAATDDVHRATEAAALPAAMAATRVDEAGYRAYLLGLRQVFDALHAACATSDDPRVVRVREAFDDPRPTLDRDLQTLPGPRDQQLAAIVRASTLGRGDESPVGLLGWLYVFQGARLGGAVLAPRVAKALGRPRGGPGLAFLTGGPETRARWRRFVRAMNAVLTPEDLPELTDAAHRGFRTARALFDADVARR